MVDPKKRTHKHKENEAIQFEFDMQTDRYDTISEEMVSDVFFICHTDIMCVLFLGEIWHHI